MPNLFSVSLVERDDERFFAVVLVALQDHQIFVEHWRGPIPHALRGDGPERLFPDELAAEVVAVEAFGAEPGVDAASIRRRRAVGISGLAMAVVVDAPIVRRPLPQEFSASAVETEYFQGMSPVGPNAVRVDVNLAFQLMLRRLRAGDDLALDGRRQENPVAPDDW